MLAAIFNAVVPTFVKHLVEEFYQRRQKKVDIEQLQEHVAQLLAANQDLARDAAEGRRLTQQLVELLISSRQDTFVLHAGKIVLVNQGQSVNVDIRQVIEDFRIAVESQVHNRIGTLPQQSSDAARSPQLSAPAAERRRADSTAHALNDFFDDLEGEIKQARLGQQD